MAITPFRILQRRSSVSGLTPQLCTLSSGELFVQLADETIYFRNDKNELVSTLTNKNLGNLCSVFAPTGDYITNSQTCNFVATSQTGQFVATSQTGQFETTGYARSCYITTGQTGAFGGGASSSLCSGINTIYESFTICSTGASGIINFDIIPNSTLLYIQNSSDNFVVNLRGSSSCSFNDLLPLNNSVSVSVMHTNGSTGYSMTGVSIDGTVQTIKWSSFGGVPPGSANAENVYSITAFKTGNNLYKVYASLGLFS